MAKNNLVFISALGVIFFVLLDGQNSKCAAKTYLAAVDVKKQQGTKIENAKTLVQNAFDGNDIYQHDVNGNFNPSDPKSQRRGNVAVSFGNLDLQDDPEALTIKGSKTQAGGEFSGVPEIVKETVLPDAYLKTKNVKREAKKDEDKKNKKVEDKKDKKNEIKKVTADDLSMRIVGGSETQIDLHPYIVNYAGYCAGSILNQYWILTAGHCGEDGAYIQAGSTRIDGGTVYKIARHITHPKFDKPPGSFNFDYQLLQLATPLQYSDTVQPIQLSTEYDIIPGAFATVIGWGATREGGYGSNMLREVDVPIIDPRNCVSVPDGKKTFIITPSMICASFPNGQKDACQGDSGGPLVLNDRLIGVVSFGIGCARPGVPGIYSRVPAVRDWIYSIAGV